MDKINAISNYMDKVKKVLTNDFRIIENWFHENVMVLTAKKYMYFGNGNQNDDFIFNRVKLPNSFEESVIISSNL